MGCSTRSTEPPAGGSFGREAGAVRDDDRVPYDADPLGPWPEEATEPRQLTLALLEDLSTVLIAHGFPPLRGYAMAELAGCLYRISRL